ncbi:hypothetical protein [Enterococcus sp. AZ101]|uniref:hypothetical protein n=1 Tax=Enterococcus sp. AZ101 TaxID=2774742 RepID=UPI003D2CF446
MMKTEKLYYQNSFQTDCLATIIKVDEKGIITDRTVAFPEGGGQIGDKGWLVTNDKSITFNDTKKGLGKPLVIPDFPLIQVDTPIYHHVERSTLPDFTVGDTIQIKLDINHRIKTTLHHTAIHLALMAAIEVRPDITKYIKGCKIETNSARLDFSSSNKFSEDDIVKINQKVEFLLVSSFPIETTMHNGIEDAWDWKCDSFEIPCGGMHVKNTNQLSKITVRRKTKGKNTERLIAVVDDWSLCKEDYVTEADILIN